MNSDTMTKKAMEAISAAAEAATDSGNPQLTPVHLAQALLADAEVRHTNVAVILTYALPHLDICTACMAHTSLPSRAPLHDNWTFLHVKCNTSDR
jgi:hypothetical protein